MSQVAQKLPGEIILTCSITAKKKKKVLILLEIDFIKSYKQTRLNICVLARALRFTEEKKKKRKNQTKMKKRHYLKYLSNRCASLFFFPSLFVNMSEQTDAGRESMRHSNLVPLSLRITEQHQPPLCVSASPVCHFWACAAP